MRVAPHHHPCQDCGAKTECSGTWEENYDGTPEVICPEFHRLIGDVNPDFLCMRCEDLRAERQRLDLEQGYGD